MLTNQNRKKPASWYQSRSAKIGGLIILCSLGATASASEEDDELARMQQQLNGEVMAMPFSAEELDKIDKYISKSLEEDTKPEQQEAPSYWQPGYTCSNIYSYGWRAYRNCRYYHRYYGRYWY